MGFNHSTDWNKILVDFFQNTCQHPEAILGPTDLSKLSHQTSAFDLSVKTHGIISYPSVNTWEDFVREVLNIVKREAFCSFKMKDVFFAVDDPNKVPKNKEQTQKSRNPDKEKLSLTDEDFDLIEIGKGDLIQANLPNYQHWLQNPSDYKKQLLSNRSFKFKVTSWLVCKMIKMLSLEYKIRVVAQHIEKSVFAKEFPEVKISEKLARERAFEITSLLDHTNGEKKISMRILPPSVSTGEGEYLCVKYINKLSLDEKDPDYKIVVHSTDTDCIPLLLLNYIGFIDEKSRDYAYKIYFHDGRRIWDMNVCHTAIWEYFTSDENKEKFKVRAPVHLLCWLMILDGNDYTEGIYSYSANNVWDYFFNKGGHKYWNWENFQQDRPPIRVDFDLGSKRTWSNLTIDQENCAMPFIRGLIKSKGEKREISDEYLNSYGLRILWTMGNMMNSTKASDYQQGDPCKLGWYFDEDEKMLKRKNEIKAGVIKTPNSKKKSSKEGEPSVKKVKKEK